MLLAKMSHCIREEVTLFQREMGDILLQRAIAVSGTEK